MPEDFATSDIALWWLAIGVGSAVVLVVILLLSFLILLVKIIDREVVKVRDTLATITKNTANTTLIAQTADGVELVLAEGLQHHLFLGRVFEKVKA